jgi:hypothetical protein
MLAHARSMAEDEENNNLFVYGALEPGAEIGLKIDQTLTQDATGTMVMLEFEAMGCPESRPSYQPNILITISSRQIFAIPMITFSCAAPA